MDNHIDLIREVLSASLHLQQSIYKYLNIPRTYGDDIVLYMREAHFLNALGSFGRMMDAEELAEYLEITHGAVTQLTERLEKKGYVYRDKDPDDRRRILRGLTPKGKAVYALHHTYDEECFSQVLSECSDFTAEELQTFIRVSDRISSCFSSDSLKSLHQPQ